MAAELAVSVLAGVRIAKTLRWILSRSSRQPESEHCASTVDWTDLPSDLLARILQLLQLPEALAVAAVCTSWRSVAEAAGDPRARIPWLVSWKPTTGYCRSSEFRNLLETHKTYKVSLPEGRCHLDWCGSSHGWLVASNEYSNLVLYHPFTFDIIHLPPITDLVCTKAVRDSDGNIVGYCYGKDLEHEPKQYAVHSLGTWFYQKVVLSCDPSQDADYVAVAIYYDANCMSFARSREGCWRLAATIADGSDDRYADCVYHDGRFYIMTLRGVLEAWDLRGPQEPSKEVIIAGGDKRYSRVLTRFLVSAPFGSLLQIRTLRCSRNPRKVKVEVFEVDIKERKLVSLSSLTALRNYAVFVGSNQSACLPTGKFPELRPNCVYLTTPRLVHYANFGLPDWRGVGIYDLENQKFEYIFSSYEPDYGQLWPCKIWHIPGV
ncbi:hypothetical protein QYE76_033917 [Lolium multiflorum]|uniref:F-box domain-containing protein n=1 Tax=Lolium multiflorum TaxID=4521 RepID=A0AAD8QZK7_LOLMU|nr:hypothetical protein QYE76_033917 [Lolium multiflorum]